MLNGTREVNGEGGQSQFSFVFVLLCDYNTRKYKMTKSSTNAKAIAMWGNHIQRVKIDINDNIIEQVTDFKYLGHYISEYKSD